MAKIKIISNGRLDMVGVKKIGKSFLITLGGAAILFIANLATTTDFGNFHTYAATLCPWIANMLKVVLGKYESK